MPEEMTQIRRLDVNFEEPWAVDQQAGLAAEIDAVSHFVAKKSVRESGQIPLEYYGNNVAATANPYARTKPTCEQILEDVCHR
jgi:UDP-glucose 4-epimerase